MDAPPTHNDQARSLEVDDNEWSKRSLHWLRQGASASPKDKRVRRRRSRDPLILAGHGVSLQIDAGTLLARNGFTHYPQKQETYRFFKGDADLPPRIIMLDGSGSITFDVLTWLNEQKVPLVKIDWTGNAVCIVSGDSFAANRDRVAWQTETRSNRRKRMEFCNALIAKKIDGCIETLETSLRRSEVWDKAMTTSPRRPRSPCKRPTTDRGRAAPLGGAERGNLFSRLACDIAAMAGIRTPSNSRRMAICRTSLLLVCTPAEAATQLTPSTPF